MGRSPVGSARRAVNRTRVARQVRVPAIGAAIAVGILMLLAAPTSLASSSPPASATPAGAQFPEPANHAPSPPLGTVQFLRPMSVGNPLAWSTPSGTRVAANVRGSTGNASLCDPYWP